MALDSSLYVRKGVVAALKVAADPPLPVERIYPQEPPAQPTRPFMQYGAPVTGAFRAACLDGSTTSVAIHGFGTGENEAHDLVAWAASALGGLVLDLAGAADCPYPATAHIEWTGTQVFRDDGGFHGIATLSISVVS